MMDQKSNTLAQKVTDRSEQVKLRPGHFILISLILITLVAWRSPEANLGEISSGTSEAGFILAPTLSGTPLVTAPPITSTAASSVTVILDNAPLLVDSEDGLLYTSGLVDGKAQTLVLSARDGRLVTTYDITGRLALDPLHDWLFVCSSQGVAVLEAQTGHLHTTIALPQPGCSAVEADPTVGRVLAFHENIVYVADVQTRTVIHSIPFNIPIEVCGDLTEELAPISGTLFDSPHQLLYLRFANSHCTPWYFETIVSFDLAAGKEIERKGGAFPSMVAFNGYLYGADWHRFGIGYRWAWQPGHSWVQSDDWNGGYPSNLVVDSKRQRLYEVVRDGNLRVFDAQSMELLMVVPQPVAGELAGFDPQTDQLYFRPEAEQLQPWPAGAIEPPHPQPLPISPLPAEPANFLVVSAHWPEDKTLLGLWGYQPLSDGCYAFGQSGGSLYISNNGGHTWGRPSRGLPANCDRISAIAMSPNYNQDQTILAGIGGYGLFRSTDGGQSWTPSSKGLLSMAIRQILLSPGFAHDRIAFVRPQSRKLYRSDDGGQTWQSLDITGMDSLAMSPQFEQDQTLMSAHSDYYNNILQTTLSLSRDGGYHWEQVGPRLDGAITMLSLAPLFNKWHVVFAFSNNGRLYRSSDGGFNWEVVLDTEQAASSYFLSAQIEFAPNIEVNRPVFFLVTTIHYAIDGKSPPSVQGTLYRSGDGGLTWQEASASTALAVSPTFAQDGLLFLGEADGRVQTCQQP